MMCFNRMDIAEAWQMYAMRYHEGFGSKLYAKLSQCNRIGYKPGPLVIKPKHLSENGRAIYCHLVKNRKYQACQPWRRRAQ